MRTSCRKSVEEWADWFARVRHKVMSRPSLEISLEQEFLAEADDDAALAQLQTRLERIVHELDQDALDAELLARLLELGNEAEAALRVQKRLDRLSVSVVDLLLQVKDRRFDLSLPATPEPRHSGKR